MISIKFYDKPAAGSMDLDKQHPKAKSKNAKSTLFEWPVEAGNTNVSVFLIKFKVSAQYTQRQYNKSIFLQISMFAFISLFAKGCSRPHPNFTKVYQS